MMEQTKRARTGAPGAGTGAAARPQATGRFSVGEIPAVLDGTLPIQRNELAVLLRERIRLAARWFVPIQRAGGAFPYTYDPGQDRYGFETYNEVRHAGVTYALFQACQLCDDEALRLCAGKAADFIVDSSVSVPEGGAAYLYQGRCKLGGEALAIVALLEGRHGLQSQHWDDAIIALAELLLGMELPDEPGRYFQSYDAATHEKLLGPNSNYYPGEALLALTRLHRAFPDGPWLDAARRAARYLIHVKDGDQIAAGNVPRDDHWLTIALSELYRFDPNPEYATIALLQADRMAGSQYQADDAEPWRIGAAMRVPTPSFPSTATHGEALDAAWELAKVRGDAKAVERCSRAALRSVQFLLRVQFTDANTTRFAHPEHAIGAWAQDIDQPIVRLDYVQHGLSALIGASRMLDAEGGPPNKPGPAPGAASIVDSRLVQRHNIWSTEPVLRLSVRCASGQWTAERIRAAAVRLDQELSRLPGAPALAFDPPSADAEGGNLGIGALIGRAVVVMQQCLGDDVTFSSAWQNQEPDVVEVAAGYRSGSAALAAAQLAVRWFKRAIESPPASFDFLAEFDRHVAEQHPSRTCRPQIHSVLAAAERRGIPVRSLDVARGMVELGSGAYGQRFWRLSTSGTSHHGVRIAKDKLWASEMLRAAGLPAPQSLVVARVSDAVRAAARLGYPVVLKPNLGNKGRDVFVNIEGESQLKELIASVFGDRFGGEWLIEQYVAGNEHRVLVIDGQVVGVNRRIPPSVMGNGSATLRELIDELNADPARSDRPGTALKPVVPGAQLVETIGRQGLDLDSVPEAGRLVALYSVSNVSLGGSTLDVTDRIHADNARVACMAAEVAGLDFAGIDLVVPDIERSIWSTGGGIVEINSNPGVIDHLEPFEGIARDVGAATLEMLFPAGQPVRARMVAVQESSDSTEICRLLAHVLAAAGWAVGCASREGLSIDGMVLQGIEFGHPHGIRTLLNNPAVEIAVVELSRGAIEEHGLGFDVCDVAVLSREEAEVERTGLRSAEVVLVASLDPAGAIVLDASQPQSIDSLVDSGQQIVPFARRRNARLDSLRASGPAVMLRGRGKAQALAVIDSNKPATAASSALVAALTNVVSLDAILAAVAAAVALGVPLERIREALSALDVPAMARDRPAR